MTLEKFHELAQNERNASRSVAIVCLLVIAGIVRFEKLLSFPFLYADEYGYAVWARSICEGYPSASGCC